VTCNRPENERDCSPSFSATSSAEATIASPSIMTGRLDASSMGNGNLRACDTHTHRHRQTQTHTHTHRLYGPQIQLITHARRPKRNHTCLTKKVWTHKKGAEVTISKSIRACGFTGCNTATAERKKPTHMGVSAAPSNSYERPLITLMLKKVVPATASMLAMSANAIVSRGRADASLTS
jgi:hypothetical protein